MSAKEKLLNNGYEGVTYLVDFSYDDALIGVSHDGRAIYDFDKMVEWMMKEEECSYEEAVEWIEFNTIRALSYMGQYGPIVVYPFLEE